MGRLALLFSLAAALFAANVKLYLKDGEYHLVREYKVDGDRVRFYSVERSGWEEVPLELVDLKRTEGEARQRQAKLEEEAKALSEEDKADRELKAEIAKIPQNAGVYRIENGELRTFKLAESKVHGNKRRSILKAVTPIPIVSGKATLELDGEKSLNVVNEDTPVFFIQLSAQQRFGIIKLTPAKGVRIVERLTIVPVTKETIEERDDVETFRHQLTPDGLYKIWPAQPLAPGEYAVVEYSDGQLNLQIWDFSVQTGK